MSDAHADGPIYADLPSLASLAFDGIVAESFPPVTETDVTDAQVESDLAERDWWTHGEEESDFDPDSEPWSPPSRFGWQVNETSSRGSRKDFGDEDAIFGKGL